MTSCFSLNLYTILVSSIIVLLSSINGASAWGTEKIYKNPKKKKDLGTEKRDNFHEFIETDDAVAAYLEHSLRTYYFNINPNQSVINEFGNQICSTKVNSSLVYFNYSGYSLWPTNDTFTVRDIDQNWTSVLLFWDVFFILLIVLIVCLLRDWWVRKHPKPPNHSAGTNHTTLQDDSRFGHDSIHMADHRFFRKASVAPYISPINELALVTSSLKPIEEASNENTSRDNNSDRVDSGSRLRPNHSTTDGQLESFASTSIPNLPNLPSAGSPIPKGDFKNSWVGWPVASDSGSWKSGSPEPNSP